MPERKKEKIYAIFVDADTQYVTVLSMDELKEKIPEGTIIAERLIKGVENTSAYLEAAKDQDWNIEDIKPYSYNVRIGTMRETTQMNQEKYRWIPNTGEYLELSDIYILLKNKIGVNITRTDINIRFAGLQDRDYSLDLEAKHGNIYKNKASSFMAKLYGSGKEIKTEKQVARNSEGIYEYRNDESDGEITVNPMGKLMYGNQPLVVAVRPINAASAYPGDDFLLRFNIVSKLTNNIVESFNSSEEDYVAVYDKKMLWRANLYIDEGEATNDKGKKVSIDWNDIHPWNVPPSGSEGGPEWWDSIFVNGKEVQKRNDKWGNNEWNKVITYNTDGTVASTVTGNGGQQPIYEWTRFNGGNVTNSVAYSWGCWDSFEQFNRELIEQRTAIKKYREDNPESDYASLQWIESQTTAPGTGNDAERWKNYLFPEVQKVLVSSVQKDKLNYGENLTAAQKSTYQQFNYRLSENAPSIPGFSSYVDDQLNMFTIRDLEGNPIDASNTDRKSSGTDCSGLVAMSANYSGNKYKLNDIDETEDYVSKSENTTTEANKSLAISTEEWKLLPDEELDESGKQKKIFQQILLSHAVPGDILIKPRYHVVFIQNLNYQDNSMLITNYNQVDVIHSTKALRWENNTWMVRKGTWENIQEVVSNYQLRRLN